MKTILCLIAVAALVCGCDQKPDPKIAALELRLAALENLVATNYQYSRKVSEFAQASFDMANKVLKITDTDDERISILETNVFNLDRQRPR